VKDESHLNLSIIPMGWIMLCVNFPLPSSVVYNYNGLPIKERNLVNYEAVYLFVILIGFVLIETNH